MRPIRAVASFLKCVTIARKNVDFAKLDRDAEIDPNLTHGITKIGEGTFRRSVTEGRKG